MMAEALLLYVAPVIGVGLCLYSAIMGAYYVYKGGDPGDLP